MTRAGKTKPRSPLKSAMSASDENAVAERQAALSEVPATIVTLAKIRDDELASDAARVSACRSILEAASVIGRDRNVEKPVKDQLNELSRDELERLAREGNEALREIQARVCAKQSQADGSLDVRGILDAAQRYIDH